jgi:hypothetical protein
VLTAYIVAGADWVTRALRPYLAQCASAAVNDWVFDVGTAPPSTVPPNSFPATVGPLQPIKRSAIKPSAIRMVLSPAASSTSLSPGQLRAAGNRRFISDGVRQIQRDLK